MPGPPPPYHGRRDDRFLSPPRTRIGSSRPPRRKQSPDLPDARPDSRRVLYGREGLRAQPPSPSPKRGWFHRVKPTPIEIRPAEKPHPALSSDCEEWIASGPWPSPI